jgi:hypothetical protein
MLFSSARVDVDCSCRSAYANALAASPIVGTARPAPRGRVLAICPANASAVFAGTPIQLATCARSPAVQSQSMIGETRSSSLGSNDSHAVRHTVTGGTPVGTRSVLRARWSTLWANGLAHGGDLRVGAASADLQRASI